MKHASASPLLAVAAALCAVAVLGSCKTVRTEKWRKGSIAESDYERRMDESVTRTYNELMALASGDESADFTHSQYDSKTSVKTKDGLFGRKKYADGKMFRTKDFAGADEYKSNEYHFLKRQDYKAKNSRDQNERFATGEAPEEKRKFFGRNKRARTKDFAEKDKLARTGDYRDT